MNESRFSRRAMRRNNDGRGHIWGGVFLLLIGAAALVKIYVPDMKWLFSWQMFLIALGVFIGAKNRFSGGAWLALILIGGYFLLERFFVVDPTLKKMFWPIALIALGIYIILRPKKNFLNECISPFNETRVPPVTPGDSFNTTGEGRSAQQDPTASTGNSADIGGEEVLDVTAVFAAVKKNIYSKNFRGGEIVSVFGGAEINLTQASFQVPQIEIESVQIFGGAKLIMPADWVIHNEAVAIFGGIEDKRPQPSAINSSSKVIVLKGFVMFGGIEIKSY